MTSWSPAQVESPMQWLKHHNISGVELSFDELLLYKNYQYLLANNKPGKIKHQMSGQYLAKTKGRGMEFDEARHYQPGDDVRAIDWRVTARTGKTHTKLFREEKDRPVFILCDLLPTMFFGSQLLFKSVQAAHMASLIAFKAAADGDKIGGVIVNHDSLFEAKPRSRQKAVLGWLNALVTHHKNSIEPMTPQEQQAKFENACAHIRRVAHPGSRVYIISDFQHCNSAASQQLHLLQKHCEVIACWINDPLETQLPEKWLGPISVTDGQQTRQIQTEQQKRHYHRQTTAMFEQKKSSLTQYNIKWQGITAGTPLHLQL